MKNRYLCTKSYKEGKFLTKGKVYEIIDGVISFDDGWRYTFDNRDLSDGLGFAPFNIYVKLLPERLPDGTKVKITSCMFSHGLTIGEIYTTKFDMLSEDNMMWYKVGGYYVTDLEFEVLPEEVKTPEVESTLHLGHTVQVGDFVRTGGKICEVIALSKIFKDWIYVRMESGGIYDGSASDRLISQPFTYLAPDEYEVVKKKSETPETSVTSSKVKVGDFVKTIKTGEVGEVIALGKFCPDRVYVRSEKEHGYNGGCADRPISGLFNYLNPEEYTVVLEPIITTTPAPEEVHLVKREAEIGEWVLVHNKSHSSYEINKVYKVKYKCGFGGVYFEYDCKGYVTPNGYYVLEGYKGEE